MLHTAINGISNSVLFVLLFSLLLLKNVESSGETFSTIPITGVTGERKYIDAVVVEPKIYAMPLNQDDIGVVDTTAGTFATIATGLTGPSKYLDLSGVAVGTNIYIVPCNQENIGKIDTSTDTFSTIPTGLTGDYKYITAVAVGTNVYAIPWNQDNIGRIDTTTDTFSTIPTGLTGNLKYNGAVAVGTKIYAVPKASSTIGIIDTITNTFSTIATNYNHVNGQMGGYFDAILVGTKIYAIPMDADNIGVIDTNSDTFSTIAITGLTGAMKYLFAIAVGTKVYAIPWNQDDIGVIDAESDTFSTIATGLTGTKKYSVPLFVGTKIYTTPFNQGEVGVIDTVAGTFDTISIGVSGNGNGNCFEWNNILWEGDHCSGAHHTGCGCSECVRCKGSKYACGANINDKIFMIPMNQNDIGVLSLPLCTATAAPNSNKAATNSITGVIGDQITVACNEYHHIQGTTTTIGTTTCGSDQIFTSLPPCIPDPTCSPHPTQTFSSCINGVNHLKDTLTNIQCGIDGCDASECCDINPTCDNVDGSDNGNGFASALCIRGTNHLKDDLTNTCATGTCIASDCCDANPTCNNIDGNGNAFASCISGTNHLKDDLTKTCTTDTCTVSDCCDVNPTCAVLGTTVAVAGFSGCVSGTNHLKDDLNTITCATGICTVSDCCEANLKCATISANFCGVGKVYDSTKADVDCAAATCSKETTSDVNACCKIDNIPDKCSTIATAPADFCGDGMAYDVAKANAECAATTCSKETTSDVTACCKMDNIPDKCSTIASAPADFCGIGKVYDSAKANAVCTATLCSKKTNADVVACCKFDDIPNKCSTIATTPADFCGPGNIYMYDSSKANSDCAGTICTEVDASTCCTLMTTTTTTTTAASATDSPPAVSNSLNETTTSKLALMAVFIFVVSFLYNVL